MATPTNIKNHKPKLSKLSRAILAVAAQREDRFVLPLPETVGAPPNKIDKILRELMAQGLIEECPAKLEDNIWRTDEEQRPLTLKITAAADEIVGGQKNDGAPATTTPDPAPGPAKRSKAKKALKRDKPSQKQATKTERILALLRRPQGASISELAKLTGWQAHSIRGFLSGTLKNKMKLKLKSERPEGKERRYRVA
jgi:hypothetical protein